MKPHVILAHGDAGFYADTTGTSIAIPRVSGLETIIKQRFSSLTCNTNKEIFLWSADDDINNDGTKDFAGVSPNFGHGKPSPQKAFALGAN